MKWRKIDAKIKNGDLVVLSGTNIDINSICGIYSDGLILNKSLIDGYMSIEVFERYIKLPQIEE